MATNAGAVALQLKIDDSGVASQLNNSGKQAGGYFLEYSGAMQKFKWMMMGLQDKRPVQEQERVGYSVECLTPRSSWPQIIKNLKMIQENQAKKQAVFFLECLEIIQA
jgi:hypothetical protein